MGGSVGAGREEGVWSLAVTGVTGEEGEAGGVRQRGANTAVARIANHIRVTHMGKAGAVSVYSQVHCV